MDSKSINKEKYITEFCGFPSNYMKSCFNMVDNNLSKKGLDVYVTSDFNIEDVDCEINLKNKSGIDYCDFISSVSRQKLSAAKCGKSDIIIQNRGIIDIYFWYQYLFKEGYINIYRLPDTISTKFCIGGDTAGDGSDYYTGHVLDVRTGEQVATFRNQFDADLYTRQMYCLGKYYSYYNASRGIKEEALIAIEVTLLGIVIEVRPKQP